MGLYHVLAEQVVKSGDLKVETVEVKSANEGLSLYVTKTKDGKVTVQNNDKSITANVAIPDVGASNGVAHVIDAVLIPAPAEALKTLTGVATSTEPLSKLAELVVSAKLDGVLDDPDGKYTVFAPTNEAFDAVPAETMAMLGKDTELLKQVLLYHVLAEQVVKSGDLKVETVEVKSAN